MKTIIVATDFSPVADNAVAYAADLAKRIQAKLVLFNAFILPVAASNTLITGSAYEELVEESLTRLRKNTLSISAAGNIEVAHELKFDNVVEELELLQVQYKADLVVLGMEESSLEQDLLGNTTTSAIRKLHCPVLVVPSGAKFLGMKKVLYSCDIVNGLSASVFANIKKLVNELNSDIEIFYVDEKIKELVNQDSASPVPEVISTELEGINYVYKNVQAASIIGRIKKEIHAFGSELLIMVPEKHGFWDSLLHRSKTRIMAAGLDIPLLSLPLASNV
jgi:nucleotide-binding universal stress UspA family protein